MTIAGVVTGVVKEIDPALGAVKVDFMWMQPPQRSHWAPIATLMSGNGRGAYLMPEIDDEVLLAFDHGQVAHPYVVGFLWNGKDAPPVKDRQLRQIRSKNGHTISLYDPDEKQGDKGYLRVEDAHGNMVELANGKITIRSKGNLVIEGLNIRINGRLVAPVGPTI